MVGNSYALASGKDPEQLSAELKLKNAGVLDKISEYVREAGYKSEGIGERML